MRFGKEQTPLDPWASQLFYQAAYRPTESDPGLEMGAEEFFVGEPLVRIRCKTPAPLEGATCFKFFSKDGELFLREGEVVLRPRQFGPVLVEGFALLPDGRRIGGQASLQIIEGFE